MLQCKKPRTHDVFRGRNAWISELLTYLKVWKLEKKDCLCFWRSNDSMKCEQDAFGAQKKKVMGTWLLYLVVKLHEDRSAWRIYNLKTAKWKNYVIPRQTNN